MKEFDVIVVGGGTAGVIAGIASARAGARTLILEKTGMLGGAVTNQHVNFPGTFHAWGKTVIAGIGLELIEKTLDLGGGRSPLLTEPNETFWLHQYIIDPFVFSALADEAVHHSGAALLMHVMPAEIYYSRSRWTVVACTKTGLQSFFSRTLIDCTGDANAVRLAGFDIDIIDEFQPATLCYRIGGYDPSALDYAAIEAAAQRAMDSGELLETDSGWRPGGNITGLLESGGGNSNHLCDINAVDSEGKTRLEHAGKQSFLRVYRFLKKQPGLENLKVLYMAAETGIRETAVIVGEHRITVDEYTSGAKYPDGLCNAYYPIDVHLRVGIKNQHLVEGVVPTVPRGALIPRGSENLAVAGRILSSDRESNSALRVQAACMAMGHAAGAMAALAAPKDIPMNQLDIIDIHHLLAEQGAIIPTITQ